MLANDLDLLKDAAKTAGEISLKYFRKDPEQWDKGGGLGPVSAADLEIDQVLMAFMAKERPLYGWLSEETEDSALRLDADTVLIIDPIDGTRAFLEGNEHFSNSLAIAHKGVVQAAVVHLPAKNQTYWAQLGQGAYRDGTRLGHSGCCDLTSAKILTSKPNLKPKYWAAGVPPIEMRYRSSLAYRMCLVADGSYDGMFTFRPTWEWDVAAGDLICQEAGVCVTTQKGGKTRYNNPTPQLDGLIATAPDIHCSLMGFKAG